jgi:phosphatidylglycerophosphatase A
VTKKPPRPAGPPGPWALLAAWGPCGYAPVAPGTVGTLGAVPLYLVLSRLPDAAYLAVLVAFTAVSMVAAHRAGRYWGVADASPIVIDEVAGYLLTMALIPLTWRTLAAGIILFRAFDVLKPWPASSFDRIKNGFGVVMDDLAAAAYAWGALRGLEVLGVLP